MVTVGCMKQLYIFSLGVVLGSILGYLSLYNQCSTLTIRCLDVKPQDLGSVNFNRRRIKQVSRSRQLQQAFDFVKRKTRTDNERNDYGRISTTDQVRVLCLVLTTKETYPKAVAVNNTWGRNCDKLLFFSDTREENLPTVVLEVVPGREHLTQKTMAAFDYLYKNHLNDADWFFKADDDTFAVIENLRLLVQEHDPEQPLLFGQHFIVTEFPAPNSYMAGGAGYVISRDGLRRLGERNQRNVNCTELYGVEDVEVSFCLRRVGVVIGESRDKLERTRFHSFPPYYHLTGEYPEWYSQRDKFEGKQKGPDSISPNAITFHYISPMQQVEINFFVHRLTWKKLS